MASCSSIIFDTVALCSSAAVAADVSISVTTALCSSVIFLAACSA
eukprot:CAMPEP_0202025404 /NCGR_PEP_ID=MMETSP0905-20130828/56444_1 /ASSEMBLY_ACC=CAM_ASM_000554 /TAXON_ID=420261 /ORGANISM="Thalassiosira antarctica, Strain CCMP982" /LENGTH=44 /DNA_ID= /DNA_START= /DNA_END= /DNA_ORIENTATION=